MSESTTIARPYAKAIFEYALSKNQLAQWSDTLLLLAQTVLDERAMQFISNPASTALQHIELMFAACKITDKENQPSANLIKLLATNKRLFLLPEIKALYEVHRAEQEKTLGVDVVSYSTVSSAQQQHLIEVLTKRLKRNVSLNISIDESLLGGAIIRAGDLVIDGSVRGKLNKLSTDLAA
jgi:F-type H+-transporting ATPase subunit delta